MSSVDVSRRRFDVLVGIVVLVVSAWVFRSAPVTQPGDSRYSMLLAENILRNGEFTLDRYELPESDYRLRHIRGHVYYYFPPGTSVLSVPLVALMHLRGASPVRPDGTYTEGGERGIDAKLARVLMAVFAMLVYFTARLLLPLGWSLGVTTVTAFGTQVFSTMSRAMWSDTWGVLLVGAAVFLLIDANVRNKPLRLGLLGTLEAWAYIVRPTNSVAIVATVLYLAFTRRHALWKFVAVVSLWLGGLFVDSWFRFHTLLPGYFAPERLPFTEPARAFFGNLLSPSRGLLIYVPAFVAVGLLLLVHRRSIRFRELATMAGFIMLGHMVLLAGFGHWWGGHCYGARLTASLVPWIVLLGVLAVDAARRARVPEGRLPEKAIWSVVGLLCAASIAINGVGAFSWDASNWNAKPSIDETPDRLWSWRRPQFLAPFEPPGTF